MKQTSIKSSVIKRFFEARLENEQNFFSHPSYALEQQLTYCISRCDEFEAKATLDEINQLERAKLAEDPVRSLKNSIICSCTLFTRAIIRGGVMPEDAFNLSDIYIQQIERLQSKEELTELEYEMVTSFIETLKMEKRPTYNFIVNKTINFIHQEILHDLSLERIANYVGVHSSYLSSTFKELVGVNITAFINRKRIEESKYFLLHSTSSLSDIAHLFGFCNQSYYTSLFKNYMGMTPKKYRDDYVLINEEKM